MQDTARVLVSTLSLFKIVVHAFWCYIKLNRGQPTRRLLAPEGLSYLLFLAHG